ncbi:acyl-coenzyme A thioesterase 9, mitochondrial-like isoform X2 [Cylas formicarius]|uniref:acyl-coenzyme A thioesterase 9, mitochondrial-like isoform X2 n=1 Tax=Cylas formicarius TaxID=197179 RepID=UPI002958BDB2|nr:acyl-coenzyme A thioesterase 9, mitochondrial-like isoform X2 [Cylas formicarius]
MALNTFKNIFVYKNTRFLCGRYLKGIISSTCNMNLIHNNVPQGWYSTESKPPNKYEGVVGTLGELKIKLALEMGVNRVYKPVGTSRAHLSKFLPKSQEELPHRSMSDSFIATIIPLSTDETLQEKYTTFLGHVRVGRLLEDMDIFAVIVARKHILNPNHPENELFPQTLVTVLVDRIDFTEFQPRPNDDIRISGHVSWVGRSTMEVVVWLEQFEDNKWHRITRALFIIAARDPTNTKATVVNLLKPASEREKTILAGGEDRKKRRMLIDTTHVSKVIPNVEEQKLIHDLYMKTVDQNNLSMAKRKLPENGVWMGDAKLSNMIFSQPEDRNLHNTVFGGFIMRHATELSWVLGYKYSKYRPVLKSISDISFKKPIAVNSLIQMHSTMVYTFQNYMQILVLAEVYNPLTGKSDTTNAFHFTLQAPEKVNEVIPLSYHEAMMYIDGRRHFMNIMDSVNLTGVGT